MTLENITIKIDKINLNTFKPLSLSINRIILFLEPPKFPHRCIPLAWITVASSYFSERHCNSLKLVEKELKYLHLQIHKNAMRVLLENVLCMSNYADLYLLCDNARFSFKN